jgi:hypothetical protein
LAATQFIGAVVQPLDPLAEWSARRRPRPEQDEAGTSMLGTTFGFVALATVRVGATSSRSLLPSALLRHPAARAAPQLHGPHRGADVRVDERGQLGGVEAVAFGVLVLVLGMLGAATAWAVVDTKVAAASAAREAARAYVESDGSAAAWEEAAGRGREAFAGHGRNPADLRLPRPAEGFGRCGPVTVTASTAVVLPRLPGVRAVARRVTVQASHTEVVDPYRAGLDRAGGACA